MLFCVREGLPMTEARAASIVADIDDLAAGLRGVPGHRTLTVDDLAGTALFEFQANLTPPQAAAYVDFLKRLEEERQAARRARKARSN